MAYLSEQDLINRIGAGQLLLLSDRDGDGQADAGAIDGAIAEAQSTINGYLTGRYHLPLDHVPPLLTRIAVDIALYSLHSIETPQNVHDRYREAIRLLDRIARDEIVLDAARVPALGEGTHDALAVMVDSGRKRGF